MINLITEDHSQALLKLVMLRQAQRNTLLFMRLKNRNFIHILTFIACKIAERKSSFKTWLDHKLSGFGQFFSQVHFRLDHWTLHITKGGKKENISWVHSITISLCQERKKNTISLCSTLCLRDKIDELSERKGNAERWLVLFFFFFNWVFGPVIYARFN